MYDQLCEHFSTMGAYRKYTNEVFLEKFRSYIDLSRNRTEPKLFDEEDKLFIMDIATTIVAARGVGIQEWLILQSFAQCLMVSKPVSGSPRSKFRSSRSQKAVDATMIVHDTMELRLALTSVAIAFYAQFAAYEVRDDLPCFDYDEMRRGQPTIWKKYGEQKACLFADILSSFAIHTIQNCPLNIETKYRLCQELAKANNEVAIGHMIENRCKDGNTIQKTLSIHEMKVGCFGSMIAAAGAIVANASEDSINNMRLFGSAIAHAAQIDNDCEPGATDSDMKQGCVNIVNAVNKELKCDDLSMSHINALCFQILFFTIAAFVIAHLCLFKRYRNSVLVAAGTPLLLLVPIVKVLLSELHGVQTYDSIGHGFSRKSRDEFQLDQNRRMSLRQFIWYGVCNVQTHVLSTVVTKLVNIRIFLPKYAQSLLVFESFHDAKLLKDEKYSKTFVVPIERGLFHVSNIFDGYIQEARLIIDAFNCPNEELLNLLSMMEKSFHSKIFAHNGDMKDSGLKKSSREVVGY